MRRPIVFLALVLLSFLPSLADAQEEPTRPEGWVHRFDHPGADASGLDFVAMPPGWHVTTGPAAILYDPSTRAGGTFRLESEIFLFDPGERREAFGVFFGGSDLEGPEVAYDYFLIRRTGEYLVKRRRGDETEVLREWTRHPAILRWEDREEGGATVRNVLAVEAGAEEVRFLVNGETVATLLADEVRTEGVVGLRVNHGLNLHVARLDVQSPDGDTDGVERFLRSYYDAFSDRDWDRFLEHFQPGAVIATRWRQPGRTEAELIQMTVEEFVAAAPEGPGSREIFEERMESVEVRGQGHLAQAWATYRARFGDPGDVAAWRGIDAFTLLRHEDRWRIVALAFEALEEEAGGSAGGTVEP